MSTSTQRERFEGVIRRLRREGITLVTILGEDAYVTSWNLDQYKETAARAGTAGRWAGITLRGGTWDKEGRLVFRSGGEAYRPIRFMEVDFPIEEADIAAAVVSAFEAEGFASAWSGDCRRCVTVAVADAVE